VVNNKASERTKFTVFHILFRFLHDPQQIRYIWTKAVICAHSDCRFTSTNDLRQFTYTNIERVYKKKHSGRSKIFNKIWDLF